MHGIVDDSFVVFNTPTKFPPFTFPDNEDTGKIEFKDIAIINSNISLNFCCIS